MENKLLRQLRFLQVCVLLLFGMVVLLSINAVHSVLPRQTFKILEAQRINIRDLNGTLRAALSNPNGFKEAGRAKEDVRFAGLMFYNEEGKESGGLTYQGKQIPGGQDSDLTLTFDQYKQDQNVYLRHEEHKENQEFEIVDGLSVMARPDWTNVKEEYKIYDSLNSLKGEERDAAELNALRSGKLSTSRVFVGVRRGNQKGKSFDYSGIFIRNKLGRSAIRLYVDDDNQPHFEVYDTLGKTLVYDLIRPHR